MSRLSPAFPALFAFMIRILIGILTICILMAGCSETGQDARLKEIAEIVSDSPQEALLRLDSIDCESISEADRHYYDFLTIKAKDKAYIQHTSDSLILDVISYYENISPSPLYAEALYYGGRVYRDMGDASTALQYFHKVLDNIPEDSRSLNLKARTLSQIGRLLQGISLYDEAIPYIEKSLKICELNKDTTNIVYELQLLGGTYLRAKKYRLAEHYFNKAIETSSNLPISFKAKSNMYLADVKYQVGQLDSALTLIRNTPGLVKPIARNRALATASDIYLAKGLLDSAYIYAHELINSPDSDNKVIGYQNLLLPELQKFIPLDTIYLYIDEYRGLLENYYDSNESQLAMNQHNFYNYQLHEREKQSAQEEKEKFLKWLYIISIVVVVLVITILALNIGRKKQQLRLHEALDNISKLKASLSNHSSTDNSDSGSKEIAKETTTESLRNRLRDDLLSIYNKDKKQGEIPSAILKSEAYKELQSYVAGGKVIPLDSLLWEQMEAAVMECSPNFKYNLQLLTGGNLSSQDYRLALLIKCGVTPTQMISLLGRTKGTVSYRREALCYKVFDQKLGSKVIDGIIRLL